MVKERFSKKNHLCKNEQKREREREMCVYKNIHENIIKTSGDKSRVHVNLKIILTSWK